jgi:hydroxycarboxylate dehydrogenase B
VTSSAAAAGSLTFRARDVEALGTDLLQRLGASEEAAEAVGRHLLTAHLMGLTSHGIIRFVQYARDIRSARIDPDAVPVVERDEPSTAVVDGGGGFGQLTALKATEVAVAKAQQAGIAIVATRRCNHVGRLGAFVEDAAKEGICAIAVAAVPRLGHFVVPWGGVDGRLGTNPIAFGFPTLDDPIVADFATSVIPEGRIRTARNSGTQLPEGAVLDAEGKPTRDPDAFYGPPMGTILPFGGVAGHKGFGIALLVELLGATLSGVEPATDDRSINGFTIVAINSGAFAETNIVRARATDLASYVRSSRPLDPARPVMVPGQPEFAHVRAAGEDPLVTIDDATWGDLVEAARSVGLEAPAPA